jgi:hypothetical protein
MELGTTRLLEDVVDRTPGWDRSEARREADDLRVAVLPQCLYGVLTAVAGVLGTAEWRAPVVLILSSGRHRHGSGYDQASHAVDDSGPRLTRPASHRSVVSLMSGSQARRQSSAPPLLTGRWVGARNKIRSIAAYK